MVLPQFSFKALTAEGDRTAGIISGKTREEAIKSLAEKNFTVTRITKVADKRSWWGGGKDITIKGEELLLLTQELASMIDAGITLKKALDIMSLDVESPSFQRVITDLSAGISAGSTFSELMRKFPSVFSTLYVSMIEAGEKSGNLALILNRLAEYIEKSENIKRKVKAAFYYPALVIAFSILIVSGIFIFGIPRLKGIYDSFGSQLPLPTRLFMDFSNFLVHDWVPITILAGTLYFFTARALHTETGQFFLDKLKISIPFIGTLFKRLAIARFARTLGTLYSSGITILDAMEMVAGSTGNRVMEKVLRESFKNLRGGESLVEPLRRSTIFTEMALSMMSAGEESGSLEKMLGKLGDFYEAQVDVSLQGLAGILEPLIMIIVGAFIGVTIMVMALPFLQLSTMLK
jgi:type IV pilus assembly protein PilC